MPCFQDPRVRALCKGTTFINQLSHILCGSPCSHMACKRRVARFWVPLCLCGFVLSTTFVDHPSFNGSVLTPSRRREANVAKPRCTPRLASSGSIYTVRAANSAMMLLVAVTLLALKNQAALAWWVGFGLHALLSSIMRRFPFPTTIPASFRREARSNLAKSYIAQAILLSITFTSESLVPTLVSRYLLFALIFLTSIFFDWPDPPLLEQAPALVFPGAACQKCYLFVCAYPYLPPCSHRSMKSLY